MNSTTIQALVAINGIKLSQPEKNLLVSLVEKYKVELPEVAAPNSKVINPLSGAACECNAIVATLTKIVQSVSYNYAGYGQMNLNGVKMPISIFDRIRYLVMKLDNKTYYAVLD